MLEYKTMKKILKITAILLIMAGSFYSCEKKNSDCHPELRYGARLKLKPKYESYCPTEDPEMKALLSKHGLGMRQTYGGFKTAELLLYYI